MSLFNNMDLVRKIENSKIQGTTEYINYRKLITPSYNGEYLSLDAKGTMFHMDGYCFGVGFGLNDELLVSDLDHIEDFINKQEASATIHFEVTPFVDQSFLLVLQERGYTLDQFLAVWVLNLEDWKPNNWKSKSEHVSIIKVTSEDSYDWAHTVALGNSDDNLATKESIESVKCFLSVSNSTAFLLKENEVSVAGAHLAITEQLGEMFLTGTIASHRGKGYQNLLIEERIYYAISKGCTHLAVTTKPNTTSARNMERNGFQLIYNKAIMKSPMKSNEG